MNILTDDPTTGAATLPSDYANLSSGWALGTSFERGWDMGGLASGNRATEQYEQKFGQPTRAGTYMFKPGTESPVLEPDAANQQYGLPGLSWDKPVHEGEAKLLNQWKREEIQRKREEIQRNDVLDRSTPGVVPAVTRFLSSMGGSAIDPVNLAASFIPVFGEARWAMLAGEIGRVPALLTRGAAEGLVGSAITEPITAAQAFNQQADYTPEDAFLDIGFGTLAGAGMRGLGAAFHEAAVRWRGAPMEARSAAMMHGIDALTEGRPVRAAEIAEPARISARAKSLRDSTALSGWPVDDEVQSAEHSFLQSRGITTPEQIDALPDEEFTALLDREAAVLPKGTEGHFGSEDENIDARVNGYAETFKYKGQRLEALKKGAAGEGSIGDYKSRASQKAYETGQSLAEEVSWTKEYYGERRAVHVDPLPQTVVDEVTDALDRITPQRGRTQFILGKNEKVDAKGMAAHGKAQGTDIFLLGDTSGVGGDVLIRLALDGPDKSRHWRLPQTARHEAIHALKRMGLFTGEEWSSLERAAHDEDWHGKFDKPKSNAGTEEAIADAFGFWASGQKEIVSKRHAGIVERAFGKIEEFFNRVKEALNGHGITRWEQIFAEVEKGNVGRREITIPKFSDEDANFSIKASSADEARARLKAIVNELHGDPRSTDGMLAETMNTVRRDASPDSGGASADAVATEASRQTASSVGESIPPERMPDEAKVRATEAEQSFNALVKDAESRGEPVATADVEAAVEKLGIFKSMKQAAASLADCMVTHGV